MALTSSNDASLSSVITPVSLSSTLSLPKSCSKHTASKIKNLVEYSYIRESAQINESSFPLLSPYHLYKRPHSFTRSIRTIISTKRPHPKEYIQSSRLDQCSLQATTTEQYVTLEIPPDLISNWKREGYTHLHIGGVRLILTLHSRKGLPVTARIAMLDTRFTHYQDAVIGTILTTLHAGSVLLTFYPNFNLSIQILTFLFKTLISPLLCKSKCKFKVQNKYLLQKLQLFTTNWFIGFRTMPQIFIHLSTILTPSWCQQTQIKYQPLYKFQDRSPDMNSSNSCLGMDFKI